MERDCKQQDPLASLLAVFAGKLDRAYFRVQSVLVPEDTGAQFSAFKT